MEFYEKVSAMFGGKKYQIPPPTLCPDCRQQRRLTFHNERKLYQRKCAVTGRPIITTFAPGTGFIVYSNDFWWSDAWDATTYGREFDRSKGCFEQFYELFCEIPKQALLVQEQENSDYANFAFHNKNCYLVFASSDSENCYFGNRVNQSKYCVDNFLVKKCENCYECITAFNCYNCNFSLKITNCRESSFLEDCIGCDSCYMCVNLNNQKYAIKNITYSKEEFFREREKYQKKTLREQKDEYALFLLSEPRKSKNHINVFHGTGENLQNAKEVKYVFEGDLLENVSYSYFVDDVKDSMDVNYGYANTVLNFESMGTGANAHRIYFSINVWPDVYDIYYSDNCSGSNHLFLCT